LNKKRASLNIFIVVAFFFLAYIVYSFQAGTVTINEPVDIANVTGTTVLINISISSILAGSDVDYVNFSFDNGTGVFQIIGSNTTQNLTVYTFTWDTTASGTGEGTNFTLLANVTFFNATGTDLNTSTDTNVNITVDNTAPTSITLNNPTDGTNSSDTSFDFNWTVIDNIATSLLCNLTVDGRINQTNIASANGTATTFTLAGFTDGQHDWNVTCSNQFQSH